MRRSVKSLSYVLLVASVLNGCATQKTYKSTYSRAEIGKISAEYFDVAEQAAIKALKPVYKKYGKPASIIKGYMSTSWEDPAKRLYGTGKFQTRLALPESLFWQISGDGLENMSRPIPTVHLVYEITQPYALKGEMSKIGSLDRRGEVFTVFERRTGRKIVVTINETQDLKPDIQFVSLLFSTF